MGVVAVQTHSVLRFPSFSSVSNQPKLGSLKAIFCPRDVLSPFKRKDLRLTISCIGSGGDGKGRQPPRRSSTSGRKTKKETIKTSSVGKKPNSANQEEIIALFRRIQSSISKEKPVTDKKINADASEEKSPAESILKVLRRSGKQGKTNNEQGKKISTRKRVVPKKYIGLEDNTPPVTGSELTRPPSNFVKRSPIPSLTVPRRISLELNNKQSTAAEKEGIIVPKVEEMKLVELKELAKSRGIKGYSRMKKSELGTLLRSQVNETPYSVN